MIACQPYGNKLATSLVFLRLINHKIVLVLIILLLPIVLRSQPKIQPTTTVITNVTVIDATGSPAKPNMTVIITENRIKRIAVSGRVELPRGALVIDGKGKFLIPGLWDMHVHTENAAGDQGWDISDEDGYIDLSQYYRTLKELRRDEKKYLAMYVANGVTGIRDMYTVRPERFSVTLNDIASGRLISPHIIKGGYPALGGSPTRPDKSIDAVGKVDAISKAAQNS